MIKSNYSFGFRLWKNLFFIAGTDMVLSSYKDERIGVISRSVRSNSVPLYLTIMHKNETFI